MTRSRPATRLGVQDWLDAGLRLLVEEGVDALKVARLSSALGVTKGSFYWHFADIAAMKSALAQHCAEIHHGVATHFEGLGARPPRERLTAMSAMLADPRRRKVEAALRRWAEVDDQIAEAVAHLDRQVLRLATDAMREIGFAESEARARASMLLYAAIGYVHAQERVGTVSDTQMLTLIDLLTQQSMPRDDDTSIEPPPVVLGSQQPPPRSVPVDQTGDFEAGQCCSHSGQFEPG